jgi:hypothetical protein
MKSLSGVLKNSWSPQEPLESSRTPGVLKDPSGVLSSPWSHVEESPVEAYQQFHKDQRCVNMSVTAIRRGSLAGIDGLPFRSMLSRQLGSIYISPLLNRAYTHCL